VASNAGITSKNKNNNKQAKGDPLEPTVRVASNAGITAKNKKVDPASAPAHVCPSFAGETQNSESTSEKLRSPLAAAMLSGVVLGTQALITAVSQSRAKNKDTLTARASMTSIEESVRNADRQNALLSIGKQKERMSASISALDTFNARRDLIRQQDHDRLAQWRTTQGEDALFDSQSTSTSSLSDRSCTIGYGTGASSASTSQPFSDRSCIGYGTGASAGPKDATLRERW
jgi:hypothetical protein